MKAVRTRNIFDPASAEPFRFSRTKLESFLRCPRCFYLDRRLGIGQPSGPPFTLNVAVDTLLKKEFDVHRAQGEPHPLMRTYGVDAIPFNHPELQAWRDIRRGVQYLHEPTNFLVFGAVDDVWVSPAEELLVVDYKATSTLKEISLDDEWKQAYKRQMEVYQWLLRRNGFRVSKRGYFVYVNAGTDRAAFDRKLEFTIQLLPHDGKDDWVEDALVEAHHCLASDSIPPAAKDCEWCSYRNAAAKREGSGLP